MNPWPSDQLDKWRDEVARTIGRGVALCDVEPKGNWLVVADSVMKIMEEAMQERTQDFDRAAFRRDTAARVLAGFAGFPKPIYCDDAAISAVKWADALLRELGE